MRVPALLSQSETVKLSKGQKLCSGWSRMYRLLSWKENLFNLEQHDLRMNGICVYLGKCFGEGGNMYIFIDGGFKSLGRNLLNKNLTCI